MKNILYILLLFPLVLIGQTTGQNYIKSTTYKQPYADNAVPINPEADVQVTYFDGLGRPVQTVQSKAGGEGQDIITHAEYDLFGRQIKEYLPFAAQNTTGVTAPYQSGMTDKLLVFYNTPKYEGTVNFYSEKRFENSPLNRVKEQAAPGEAWKLQGPDQSYFYFETIPALFDHSTCISNGLPIKVQSPTIKIEVKNGVLTFLMKSSPSGDWLFPQDGCVIQLLSIPLENQLGDPFNFPDIDLGELKNNYDQPTGYRAIIQNNNLKFKPVNTDPNEPLPLVKLFNTKMSFDISQYLNTPDSHTVKFEYQANATNEIRRFGVDFTNGNTEKPELTTSGYYVANQLYKTITKNENWKKADGKNNTVEEFTNNQGQVILKRAYNEGKKHDTYYIYDKFSNLTFVLPPLASDAIVKNNLTIAPVGVNYPWTKLFAVDPRVVAQFDSELTGIANSDLLNVDLIAKYGSRGGFSIVPDEADNITLTINMVTTRAMPFNTGVIADLSTFGTYADKELGRITGIDYRYIFTIRDNKVEVDGYGNVPSFNGTLNGNTKLEYTRNYPWTKLCIAGDPLVAEQYDNDIKELENSEILTTYTPNSYEASGGASISLDRFDNLTISININTAVEMPLVTGTVFPLDIERSITDRTLGTISGSGYSYEFSIKDNSLYIEGSGKISSVVHFSSQVGKGTFTIEQQVLEGLCYIYHYDYRNRVIEKHIPDNGWTYLIYDQLDRVAITQDENLRSNPSPAPNWLFTKYDKFDRVIMTGSYRFQATREQVQNWLNAGNDPLYETRSATSFLADGQNIYYTNTIVYPEASYLTVNYYDNHDFDTKLSAIGGMPSGNSYNAFTANKKALPTGGHVRVLGTDQWVTNVIAYDEKARPIWNWQHNPYLGTTHGLQSNLDFTGRLLETLIQHKKGSTPTITVYDYYTYDNGNRLVTHSQKIGSQAKELLTWNIYDALGQLQEKKVGEETGLSYANSGIQRIDYTYNIRGWLKTINNPASMENDLFAFGIKYTDYGGYSKFNGNIAQTYWKSASDNTLRRYDYEYDALNRLTDAGFYKGGIAENYHEGNIQYDKNGNIIRLVRSGLKESGGLGIMDVLTYIYKPYSNQLLKVTDIAYDTAGFKDGTNGGDNDYSYDAAGNMKMDLNKGIGTQPAYEITYNHLNLPVNVMFSDTKKIQYVYSATGEKLRKTVTDGTVTTTDYVNGYVYQNGLNYFPNSEGYAKKETNGSFSYIYQYKDHLGNVRLSYWKNGTALQIIEETNYYPFGMQHDRVGNIVTSTNLGQKIKYNGKELQEELQLGWYDYQARNYDPAIGRWFNVDPLAEISRRWSPYTYAYSNPIYFVDPDGMLATDFELQDGGGNGWPPPGTLPPGSPMKKYEKFVPSKQTVSLIQEGVALLGDVFDYSAEVEASYGVGLNFKAGPLKGKVEASAASISASSNKTNILEVEVKGLDASVEGGLGDNKATAGITGVSGKVEINKKTLKPTASGELVKGSASAKKGSISLSNSGTLSLGGKIGPVKASVSADLYKAAKGLSKIVQSGVSYLTDYLSHTFD